MTPEWKIQLNNKIYGCYCQQLLIEDNQNSRLATLEEAKLFLQELMTIELDDLKDAYLIERVDLFRDHLKALNFSIEFFHSWNEESANSYTEYVKIMHPQEQDLLVCYKQVTLPKATKEGQIADEIGPLQAIEPAKYEVAKDSKIGSIKLQLLDLGITEIIA